MATALVASVFIVGVAGVAGAQSMKVGIVDLSILISESDEGKRDNAELNQLIAERQAELDQREASVLALRDRLEDEANALSDQERARLEEEYQTLSIEYLTIGQEYEAEIQARADEMRDQLLQEIASVLQWYGDTKEYTLILDASTVYYYRQVIDLTWEILREYNDLKAAGKL